MHLFMTNNNQIVHTSLESEIQKSYIDYAMSVIVGRALPDVRDGLKPVHRRVLYAMHALHNNWNKPYKKSARVVGDTLGKYHPHGDSAIYDSIVRMAQDFSMRYMLVDGHGNFGSVDGDSAASMRYTEIRLAKISHEMLDDLDKETVDFIPNFDNSESMPSVLPAKIPNLLINGSSGIAVGMATNIPPHNLKEIIGACMHMIDNPHAELSDILGYVKGPDFPTAASIHGRSGILQAYTTGRGKIYLRAKAEFETHEKQQKTSIIITELPYTVNKARLCEKIGLLVREKRIEGITAVRDESNRKGMRVVIECRRGENAEVILNQLYSLTQLQTVFGINMVCLDKGRPKCMSLMAILKSFLDHRQDVVRKRLEFEVRKARKRAHIVEGLAVAITNIDPVIELIKKAKSPQEAKEALLAKTWSVTSLPLSDESKSLTAIEELRGTYGLEENGQYRLSVVQIQAILDMRLHRLTGLEREKILLEYNDLIAKIRELLDILSDRVKFMALIRSELEEISTSYGDDRRTEIFDDYENLDDLDLIKDEHVVVTKSQQGYLKSQTLDEYRVQRRGGRGKSGASIKQDDVIDTICTATRHQDLLCFTNLGRVYQLPVRYIPISSRTSKGKPANNFLPLQDSERVQMLLSVRDYHDDAMCVFATKKGVVKKVSLKAFSNVRSSGIIAINLVDDDELVGMQILSDADDIMLFSSIGKAIRFKVEDIRCTGRTSQGVIGMRLGDGQSVVALLGVTSAQESVFIATENGYGKRTPLADFRKTGRGGQGVIAIQCTERNGHVVGVCIPDTKQDLMLVTNAGTIIRVESSSVSSIGRNTQGVRLLQMQADVKLVGCQVVDQQDLEEAETVEEV
mgnify:CR=1 FL=1|tara:strand:- start:1253 stop:3823 length:2571 start_codon:yes stop_codon:yes gene_type:complete